jgi:hypothetical protein
VSTTCDDSDRMDLHDLNGVHSLSGDPGMAAPQTGKYHIMDNSQGCQSSADGKPKMVIPSPTCMDRAPP